MLVYNHDEVLAEWIGWQLGIKFALPYTCIGIMRGDALTAAVLYNNYQPPNIQMTIASVSPRWASPQVIGRLFAYPFNELQCLRVTAVTKAMNQPARAFLCRLGFVAEGFHPLLFADGDGVSYGLLKRDAQKWLEKVHEKRRKSAPGPESLSTLGGPESAEHRDGAGQR